MSKSRKKGGWWRLTESKRNGTAGNLTLISDSDSIIAEQREASAVQTVILAKDKFKTEDEARTWIAGHELHAEKIDETPDSWRFRQREQGDFQDGSFRTIELDSGVKAVVGRKKRGMEARATDIPSGLADRIMESAAERGYKWRVKLITAGETKTKNRIYPAETLRAAREMYEGARAFSDHPTPEEDRLRPERTIKDIVGWFDNVEFSESEKALLADFTIAKNAAWLRDLMCSAHEAGKRDIVQFSHNVIGEESPIRHNGGTWSEVNKIKHVDSVDCVTVGNAGGEVVKMIESERKQREAQETEDTKMLAAIIEWLKSVAPELVKDLDPATATVEQVIGAVKKAVEMGMKPSAESAKAVTESIAGLEKALAAGVTKIAEAEARRVTDVRLRETADKFDVKLKESKLPEPFARKLREQYKGVEMKDEAMDAVIKAEKEAIGALHRESPMRGTGIEVGTDQVERHRLALVGFFKNADQKDKDGKPVARFHYFREAYSKISGRDAWTDPLLILRESTPRRLSESMMFGPDQRLRETIDTTTFAELLGDSITRIAQEEYQLPEFQEWRKIASVESVTDFRVQRRPQVGGYAKLVVVGESGTYPALSTLTDSEETYTIAKRGGVEKLTLEMIANDDQRFKIRRLPRNLGNTAAVTLFETVFDIFKDSPTMGDGFALFNGPNHNNTMSDAFGETGLDKARLKLRKQTVPGASAQFIGNRVVNVIVPPDLQTLAEKIRDSRVSVAANEDRTSPNVHQGFNVIVVDYYSASSATRWFATGDPSRTPIIEVGFWMGNENPQIFVQDADNSDTQFDKDETRYKVRHIYQAKAMDFRNVVRGGV